MQAQISHNERPYRGAFLTPLSDDNSILSQLQGILPLIGTDGGRISASVYDTAQLLRAYPPPSGVQPGLAWLKRQQQADGGWGSPAAPLYRRVSTIAALLALHQYADIADASENIAAAQEHLRFQRELWAETVPDSLPVGAELIYPYLIDEAARLNLHIPRQGNTALLNQGRKKLKYIVNIQPEAGSPPMHSWEAWGEDADPSFLDGAGSIGHSPAATAVWLSRLPKEESTESLRQQAESYLDRASRVTGFNIPGVVPGIWPMCRFELAFSLYPLLIADLLDLPELQRTLRPQLNILDNALTKQGIGLSDYFYKDGDDTAASLAILHAAGYQVDPAWLDQFRGDGVYYAFAGEIQQSLSLTARAVHTLRLFGRRDDDAVKYLLDAQGEDGRWQDDKWHISWLYNTLHLVLALAAEPAGKLAMIRAEGSLLQSQQPNGGWGVNNSTTPSETAFAILALYTLHKERLLTENGRHAFTAGQAYLKTLMDQPRLDRTALWIEKELYVPSRIEKMFELCALLVAID
ncbi:hypothetical protein MNBD_CHLOROFLEXI01-1391 [hydrothermal vent metagenome]|uniref:Squalene cyclase C-terminal domain-containing protein n=1 Tax=hydrothermal vent metagenome TaxID=652676 RepID=A0A3B0VPT3_9ZZZZ